MRHSERGEESKKILRREAPQDDSIRCGVNGNKTYDI